MKGSDSFRIDLDQERKLQSLLEKSGYRLSESDYAFWRATGTKHTLTLYRSGKLLIQGKTPDRLAQSLIDMGFKLSDSHPIAPEKHGVSKWIGTDESGKGDYFGPLVVAGVLVTSETRKQLITMGVKDSKRLSDTSIRKLAPRIRDLCPHSIVVIPPSRYNKAYATNGYGKIYRILAWGHAKAIENILEKEDCHYALIDQFGHEKFMKNALMEKGKLITLEMRPHAEDDMSVAAASILARNEYMESLAELSHQYLITLTLGASDKVIETGRQFVLRHGADKLKEIAKTHFSTHSRCLDSAASDAASNYEDIPEIESPLGTDETEQT